MATQIKVEVGQVWHAPAQNRKVVIISVDYVKGVCGAKDICFGYAGSVWHMFSTLTPIDAYPTKAWGEWNYIGMEEAICIHDCCKDR